MEEDTGVKAPVTRLRKRLSVEQPEESKSPAPNTPTKRRAGRRTAKPELELIEENATSKTSSDKTKKTVTKDLIDAIEEKPITPSRRSARIRSNTSISETTFTVDSPRAKRAARRLSQVGSDNEAPITPARQTRRTRKDSASSIDKVENQAAIIQSSAIPEPIAEESESNNRKSITDQKDERNTSITTRKSPRLMGKIDNYTFCTSSEIDNVNNLNTNVEDTHNSSGNIEITGEKIELVPLQPNTENYDHTDNKNETKVNKNERLSINSSDLLENMNFNPNKITHILNKSTSALENLISKNKRFRTKSYTSGTIIISNDPSTIYYSDSESSKKTATNHACLPFILLNKLELNDSQLNKSRKKDKSLSNDSITIAGRLSVCDEKNNSRQQTSTVEINSKAKIDDNENNSDKNPSADLQIMVLNEDYDSNSEKLNRNEDDQRVPEVTHIIKSSSKRDTSNTSKQNINTTIENIPEKKQMNDNCEPMDVDETIPDSLLIEDAGNEEENKSNQSIRKSKRKSSIMLSLNESLSQSKSTLIQSHLKDTFTSKKNKSPLKLDDKRLSNSSPALNTSQDNVMHKKIKSDNYSTSTPLQQKSNEKGISLNNTNIKSNTNNDLKITNINLRDSESDSDLSESKNIKRKPKKDKYFSKKEPSSNSSEESDNESSQKSSNILDDEAEDAGDDYMSGDSQDEEERQEALENEIRDKGKTLSSEDLSNDSDYEKDSFVVSSAEEDNELLEGTEDDLSMSDNELSMSAKSKKKYNEKKLKEQKRASRKIFESRHQSNISKNSSVSDTKKKSKKIRQMSSSSESDVEIKKLSKVKNKQRLDSSHDITMTKDENSKTSRRSKTPSQSICNESVTMDNEKEITISNQSSTECDPLSQLIKEEPKTPHNSNTSMAFIDAHNETTESSSKECENLDPLATTIVNDDSSMSSDNERIVQEYDSILEGLNKTNKKLKNTTGDISLNLEHKKNKKDRNPIVDELNLTQVKSKKIKNKTDNPNKNNEEKIAANPSHTSKDENSSSSESESVLLHLLFSEESNNCEDSSNKTKDGDKSNNVENKSDSSIIINETLPKTPGSDKKKKKRQSESSQYEESSNNDFNNQSSKTPTSGKKNKKEQQPETSLREKLNTSDTALDESFKTPTIGKKKKQRKYESDSTGPEDIELKFFIDTEGTKTQDDSINNKSLKTSKMIVSDKANDSDSDAPQEILFRKEKNTSYKIDQEAVQDTELAGEKSFNQSMNKMTGSSKKKKKKSLEPQTGTNESISIDQSHKTNIESAKKKKNRDVPANNVSFSTGNDVTDIAVNKSNIKTPGSEKKKQKHSDISTDEPDNCNVSLNKSKIKTPESSKKNKQLLEEATEKMSTDNLSVNKSVQNKPQSEKKNKNKSQLEVEPSDKINVLSEVNASIKSSGSKKKQKRLSETSQSESNIFDNKSAINTIRSAEKKSNDPDEVQDIVNKGKMDIEQHKNKKRKRNMSTNISEEGKDSREAEEINTSILNKKKKVKLTHEGNDTESSKKNKNKKRKEREDDNDETSTKAFKENSLKKLKVSRLPTSLLEQLDEKPRKQRESPKKKAKLIATTNFIVEEAKKRRNKPSMYLEDSIYLNEDDDNESKKNKANNVKPKVLPFVPTASTSISGYTSNFKVNVLPKDTKFVAQSSNIQNFKTDYLYNKKIKRIGTYELYKKSRNIKLAKF